MHLLYLLNHFRIQIRKKEKEVHNKIHIFIIFRILDKLKYNSKIYNQIIFDPNFDDITI